MHAMPPPAAAPEIDADILAALDPEEREQILEEQRQMLAQFESSTKKPAAASYNSNHHASNNDADFDVAEAMAQFDQMDAQLAADAAIAEELQKKEYGKASNARAVAAKKEKTSAKTKTTESQSWYNWMTGKGDAAENSSSSSKSKNRSESSSDYPANTTSTTSSSSASRGPRLVAAQTGDETPLSNTTESGAPKQSLFASAFGKAEEESTLVAVPQFSRQRN